MELYFINHIERSKIKFPLIIDTPVKGMDSAGKRRTARFISKLESQFVCFVIDEDKPNFTDKFNEIMEGKGNFITAFRRSMSLIDWLSRIIQMLELQKVIMEKLYMAIHFLKFLLSKTRRMNRNEF